MQNIFVKPGARIFEQTEGRQVPLQRIVGQAGIMSRGRPVDADEPNGVWEFRFQSRWWTVERTDIEVRERE